MKMLKQLIFWTVCIVTLAVVKVGFIFFLLGFLPTIITYFIDESPRKDFYKCVRACNLAGMMPTIAGLLTNPYPAAELQLKMAQPEIWLLIYVAAASGWVLVWLCRGAAFVLVLTTSDTRIKMLEKAQKEMVTEWGNEITLPHAGT